MLMPILYLWDLCNRVEQKAFSNLSPLLTFNSTLPYLGIEFNIASFGNIASIPLKTVWTTPSPFHQSLSLSHQLAFLSLLDSKQPFWLPLSLSPVWTLPLSLFLCLFKVCQNCITLKEAFCLKYWTSHHVKKIKIILKCALSSFEVIILGSGAVAIPQH